MRNSKPADPGDRRSATGLVIAALDRHVAWGDIENDLDDVQTALESAVLATSDAEPWEEYSRRHGLGGEFSLSVAEIKALPVNGQLAYVGQLVGDVTLRLGTPPSKCLREGRPDRALPATAARRSHLILSGGGADLAPVGPGPITDPGRRWVCPSGRSPRPYRSAPPARLPRDTAPAQSRRRGPSAAARQPFGRRGGRSSPAGPPARHLVIGPRLNRYRKPGAISSDRADGRRTGRELCMQVGGIVPVDLDA
jgi:hypothetical protein